MRGGEGNELWQAAADVAMARKTVGRRREGGKRTRRVGWQKTGAEGVLTERKHPRRRERVSQLEIRKGSEGEERREGGRSPRSPSLPPSLPPSSLLFSIKLTNDGRLGRDGGSSDESGEERSDHRESRGGERDLGEKREGGRRKREVVDEGNSNSFSTRLLPLPQRARAGLGWPPANKL